MDAMDLLSGEFERRRRSVLGFVEKPGAGEVTEHGENIVAWGLHLVLGTVVLYHGQRGLHRRST